MPRGSRWLEDVEFDLDRELASTRLYPCDTKQLFESVDTPRDDTGVRPAPPENFALWVKLVARMGPDELADLEARTFKQWDRASLGALRIAIDCRRRNLRR
jgi:hypothetical protein